MNLTYRKSNIISNGSLPAGCWEHVLKSVALNTDLEWLLVCANGGAGSGGSNSSSRNSSQTVETCPTILVIEHQNGSSGVGGVALPSRDDYVVEGSSVCDQ